MKNNLLKLAILAATLTVAVSCTKQDEPLIENDNQQATEESVVRSAVPKIEYIAGRVDANSFSRNVLTCDKYGNAYFVSKDNDLSPRRVMRVDGVNRKVSVMLAEERLMYDDENIGVVSRMGIAVDGNGDLYVSTLVSLRKYNTSGTSTDVDFTSKMQYNLPYNHLYLDGITADINDNIYAFANTATTPSKIFRIAKTGAVRLLPTEQPFNMYNGGIYKGRGANLFGYSQDSYHKDNFMHMYTNETPTVVKTSPVKLQGMGAGMDNGFLYVLSGYTIQRINPNNFAVKQMATLPTEMDIAIAHLNLGVPTHIAPTPDATVFYVAYDSGYLIKVTL